MTAYGASKAAVIHLTRSAAVALAPELRVNCCCPGAVDTDIWDVIDRGYEASGAPDSLRSGKRPQQQPLPGSATPEQIAGAIAFLAGPDSQHATGAVLDVNGGYAMH
jgi:meso-butanediol dehydrogenase/(S,S)-butanediol dehydrogenase/diacetyl reductase